VSAQIAATGQDANVGAILIHPGEPFDPLLFRPGISSMNTHAAVEIAAVAGHALIDRVRDDMRDPRQMYGCGEILRAGELLGRRHVPQPELRLIRPSLCRVMRPVTSAWALMVRQSASAAARRRSRLLRYRPPDRSARTDRSASDSQRSPEWTLRATSVSFGLPPTKYGIAIGIGWMLPFVTSMLTCAPAVRDCNPPSRLRRSDEQRSVASQEPVLSKLDGLRFEPFSNHAVS